ncbi:MAG TPA: hypothetical protein VNT30_15900 [Stellaceae bacterium]|nr:hypothetical protein [Stellaceae bacterium]
MGEPLVDVFRLTDSPDRKGLCCDKIGVAWGPLALLDKKTDHRMVDTFTVRDQGDLERIIDTAFGIKVDFSSRISTLRLVAKSLNAGDIGHAQMMALHLKLPELPDAATSTRLQIAEKLVKLGFDINQPRDEHGRWTDGGSAATDGAKLVPLQAIIEPFLPEMIIPFPPEIFVRPLPPEIGPLPILPDTVDRRRSPPSSEAPEGSDPDCPAQWEDAYKRCDKIREQWKAGHSTLGNLGKDYMECLRTHVSTRCGGY